MCVFSFWPQTYFFEKYFTIKQVILHITYYFRTLLNLLSFPFKTSSSNVFKAFKMALEIYFNLEIINDSHGRNKYQKVLGSLQVHLNKLECRGKVHLFQ